MAWVIVALACAASVLCIGIAIGHSLATTNPSQETPIRTVKVRGGVVDIWS